MSSEWNFKTVIRRLRSKVFRMLPGRRRKQLRAAIARLGWEHRFLRLRRPGLALLCGKGIEIGAFEHPAPLSRNCHTYYVDAITPAQAATLFPEIDAGALVTPDYVVDVSTSGLGIFAGNQWDYAIACHVIEHLPNPAQFIGEMFRIVPAGGMVVIAAPDKRFTFDHSRPETPVELLQSYFLNGRTVSPDDYLDISRYVHPADMQMSENERKVRLQNYYNRREHLNVWTSSGFREFLTVALGWNEVVAAPVYEVMGEENRFEYFGVWQKS